MFCQHAQTQYLKLEEYTVIHVSEQMYYIECICIIVNVLY